MRTLIAMLMLAAAMASPAAAAEITLNKTVIGCLDPAVLLNRALAIQLAEQHQAAVAKADDDDTDFKNPEFHRCSYFRGPDTSKYGPFRYWTKNLPTPSVLAGKKVVDLYKMLGDEPYWVVME
jgi:hypothetical protein